MGGVRVRGLQRRLLGVFTVRAQAVGYLATINGAAVEHQFARYKWLGKLLFPLFLYIRLSRFFFSRL